MSTELNAVLRAVMLGQPEIAETEKKWWEPCDPRDIAALEEALGREISREATMALPRLGHAVRCCKCGSAELRRFHRSIESQGCATGCHEHFEHMMVACTGCGALVGKERPLDCRGDR